MQNEIEAQFLDINKDKIRQKLKALGTKLIEPEVLMKRVVFSLSDHSYARVRDEGDKIVMTYKNVLDENSILGTKEVNIVVNDYENAIRQPPNLAPSAQPIVIITASTNPSSTTKPPKSTSKWNHQHGLESPSNKQARPPLFDEELI